MSVGSFDKVNMLINSIHLKMISSPYWKGGLAKGREKPRQTRIIMKDEFFSVSASDTGILGKMNFECSQQESNL